VKIKDEPETFARVRKIKKRFKDKKGNVLERAFLEGEKKWGGR